MIRSWSALKLKLVVVVCMAALGALAVGAGEASAAPRYAFSPPPFGSLNLAVGVVADNSSGLSAGDVFGVAKVGATVEKFNGLGNPVNFTEFEGGTTNVLTGKETPAERFQGPTDGAIDTAGNLYVVDEEYAALPEGKGLPVTEFNDTTGKYIPLSAGAFIPPASATTHGPFTPFGITVDNSGNVSDPNNGDVFVTDHVNHAVDKFTASGTFISQFGAAKLKEPDTIVINASGEAYVSNRFINVQKFGPTGTFVLTLDENEPQSVGIDPSNGNIFVADNSFEGEEGHPRIQEYNSSDTSIAQFAEGGEGIEEFSKSFYGMDVSASTHDVYMTNINRNNMERFESGEEPETPVTEAATEVKGTSAELHGELNPGGATGTVGYHFAFYTEGTCALPTGGAGNTPSESVAEAKEKKVEKGALEANVAKGLAPKTKYKFCIVATNPFGAALGNPELEFETTAGEPVVERGTASEETTTTAKISTNINPSGAATTCEVEYGLEETYGTEAACPTPLGEGLAPVPVSIVLEGLAPNKTYHYRFTATNGQGTVHGEDATLTTKPLVTVVTEAASEIQPESAKLNGTVTPGEEGATYYFEYRKVGEPTFTKVGEATIPANQATPHHVSVSISGLAAGTKYQFNVLGVATGSAVVIPGTETEFETLVSKPLVTNKSPSGITRTGATVAAEINTENSNTEYKVEYGTSSNYGESTSLTPLAAQVGASTASQPLAGLSAGTVYHYRFVATNGTGTTNGPDGTFETEAPKLPIIESEGSAQVTQTTATITATVNPNGLQTSYILEVGTEVEGQILYTPSFGEVGSEAIGVPLVFGLSGLQPGTTYHYRIVAQNEDGTVFGADQTFATPGFPAVIIPPPPVQIIPTTLPPTGKSVPVPPVETRTQKYKKAVKLCEKKPKKKRASCLRTAKKRFGPVTKAKKKKK